MTILNLFKSTPAAFWSAYSLTESVERLRKVVKPSMFQAMFEEGILGLECLVALALVVTGILAILAKADGKPLIVIPRSNSCHAWHW